MITASDFSALMAKTESDLRELILDMMQDYRLAGVPEREPVVRRIFEMLGVLLGVDWNPNGSFTSDGAKKAFNDEANLSSSTYEVVLKVFGRLADLEKGNVNFEWISKAWATKWRPWLYKKGSRTLAAKLSSDITAGAHEFDAPDRPYGGNAMAQNASKLAEDIDKLLLRKLPIRRA